MYYDNGIIYDEQQPSCVRGGEYNGIAIPCGHAGSQAGNFTNMNRNSHRERILEIDDQLIAANEEYKALSGSLLTSNETVKDYIQTRIAELKALLNALELERSRLLAIAM